MPYTPGPWWNESGVIHAKGPKWTPEFHSCVHPGYANDNFSWEEAEANGNLMAAAPTLLEALQAVEWVPDGWDQEMCPWCFEACPNHAANCMRQAAIAAAEEG